MLNELNPRVTARAKPPGSREQNHLGETKMRAFVLITPSTLM